MNNKKIFIINFITFIIVVVLSFFISNFIINKKIKDNSAVIATSTIGNVTINDVTNYLKILEKTFGQKFDVNSLKKEEKELIVTEIINNRVVLEKAKKSRIRYSQEYKTKLKELEDNLLREMFLQRLIAKNITEEAMKERYDEVNKSLKGKKEYKVKHIVVKTKAEILDVIKQLKDNTFEELAEKYSIDNSKDSGGDLGYVIEGQTVKEFDDVLKKQPLNELSEPFETQFGWHILIKEDERDASITDYEKTKDIIKNALIRDFVKNYTVENIKDKNINLVE